MAHPVGFEPTTPGFVGRCSNPAELRVRCLKGALLSGRAPTPSRKPDLKQARGVLNLPEHPDFSGLLLLFTTADAYTAPVQSDEQNDSNQPETRFHGWRLLGFIMSVVVVLALISLLVDWMVIGPLEGRAF